MSVRDVNGIDTYDTQHNVFKSKTANELETELDAINDDIEDIQDDIGDLEDAVSDIETELEDYVKVDGTPEDGDVLVYDDTSDTWKPDAPSGGGGGAGVFTIEVTGTWNETTQQVDVAIEEATIEAAVAAIAEGEASLICLSYSITGETDHDYEYLSPIRVYYSSPDNWDMMMFSGGVIQGESNKYTGVASWIMQTTLDIPFYDGYILLEYINMLHVYANYAID